MASFRVPSRKRDVDDETPDDFELAVKIWEKTIDVQMHFNELQMKIRNFSILLVSSLVGVGGVAMKENLSAGFVPLAPVLFFVALLVWGAYFFMDHFWYYPLLLGSVNHGAAVEKFLLARLPIAGLTKAIGDASPKKLLIWNLRSKHKSLVFYGIVAAALVVLALFSAFSKPKTSESKDANSQSQQVTTASSSDAGRLSPSSSSPSQTATQSLSSSLPLAQPQPSPSKPLAPNTNPALPTSSNRK